MAEMQQCIREQSLCNIEHGGEHAHLGRMGASWVMSAIASVPQVWQAIAVTMHAVNDVPCRASRSLRDF